MARLSRRQALTRGFPAQHWSSASLMGGMELLEDLHGLTWVTVLRWAFSGSSVNHVFSEGGKHRSCPDLEPNGRKRGVSVLPMITNDGRSISLCPGLSDKEARALVTGAPPSPLLSRVNKHLCWPQHYHHNSVCPI